MYLDMSVVHLSTAVSETKLTMMGLCLGEDDTLYRNHKKPT